MKVNLVSVAKVAALALLINFYLPQTSMAAANTFSDVTSADDAATQLLGTGGSGIQIISGSAVKFGSVKSFSSIDLGTDYQLNKSGIFLTSETSLGADATSSSASLRSQLENMLKDAKILTRITNVSSLSFDFETKTTSVKSLSMDFLFASQESYDANWDFAAVIVDDINYAFLPGNLVLRVRPESNLTNFNGKGFKLNGRDVQAAAPVQSITALLDLTRTVHNVKITVSDTDDEIVPTMFMITSLNGSTSTSGGISEGPAPSTGPTVTSPAAGATINGTVGSAFTYSMAFTSSASPETATVASGDLPPGLSISTSGVISGTPTTAGTYTFSLTVTDNDGNATTITGVKIVVAGAPPLISSPSDGAALTGTVGSAFTYSMAFTSSASPETATVASGDLPPGLSISTSGVISGTPTTAGTYTFSLTVTDNDGNATTITGVTITISSAPKSSKPIREFPTPSPTTPTDNNQSNNSSNPATVEVPSTPILNYGNNNDPIKPKIGEPITLVNNEPVTSTLIPVENNSLKLITNLTGNPTDQIVMQIQSKNSDGTTNNLASNSSLEFRPGGLSSVSGSGFQSNSIVKAWIFSDPKFLGNVNVNSKGEFNADLFIPKNLPVGKHTLQFNGIAFNGKTISASVVVIVNAPKITNQAIIKFAYKSTSLSSSASKIIRSIDLKNAKSVKIYGYAANDKTNDDVRVSLFRALEVKKALQKKFPKVNFEALGKGAKKNAACSKLENLCAVVEITN